MNENVNRTPIIENYNKDDVNYWNKYYEKNLPKDNSQSKFAEFVLPKLNKNSVLLELGCGNGRDSLYFLRNGIK